MKTSNKILLIVLISILVIITGLIISARVLIKTIPQNTYNKYDEDEIVTKIVDLNNFNAIETNGAWQLKIKKGSDYFVEIEYPESEADGIEVNIWNGCLRFDTDNRWKHHHSPFRARITMPDLTGLETKDGASVDIEDFFCEDLNVRITGAAEIDAENTTIKNLTLRCDGAADANFKDSQVFNAKLNVNGASRILLTMDGGKLSGSANGASSIIYYGTVSSENIATSGAVSLRHRD